MTKTLISKADLAKKAGVSRAAVTQACKKKLLCAVNGNQVDLSNPVVLEWLSAKVAAKTLKDTNASQAAAFHSNNQPQQQDDHSGFKPDDEANDGGITAEETLKKMLESTRGSKGAIPDLPDISVLVTMPLGEIIRRFGTDVGFEGYLKSRKLIEEIKIKSIDAEAKRGDYIPRDLVEKRILPLIDNANTRLVDDMPDSLASALQTLVKNNATRLELSEHIRKEISSILKSVKHTSVQYLAAV